MIGLCCSVTLTRRRSKPEGGDPAPPHPPPPAPAARPDVGLLTVEEIDCYWMANAKGVDHALHYAKMWSKVQNPPLTVTLYSATIWIQ